MRFLLGGVPSDRTHVLDLRNVVVALRHVPDILFGSG
jgi:hypothetical protein